MAVKRLKDLPKDLDKKISRGFNAFISEVHAELSKEENMPVWTGFFASSWKASNTPVQANHKVENYQPWASIKRERSLDFFARRKAGPPFTKQTRPENPEINPRFPVGTGNKIFNYRKSVFIGNKAIYSQYVLETGKIQNFIADDLPKLLKKNMSDKGKLFIGTKASEKTSGTIYTGFEG